MKENNMQSRKDYKSIIKHELLLSDDLIALGDAVNEYEKNHTQKSGFPDDDLVKLNHEVDKLSGKSYSSFTGSTRSLISNIFRALTCFKKPSEILRTILRTCESAIF